jgi:hypothetical protein
MLPGVFGIRQYKTITDHNIAPDYNVIPDPRLWSPSLLWPALALPCLALRSFANLFHNSLEKKL